MLKKRNYKVGEKVFLIGYPNTEFTVKRIFIDSSNNLVFSLLGVKPSGNKIKFEKDESHILCSVEEYNETFS